MVAGGWPRATRGQRHKDPLDRLGPDVAERRGPATVEDVPDRLPDFPDDSQAHSYTFSLASNLRIPTRLNPTLVLFYDPFEGENEGLLLIYRQEDANTWIPLPTYVKPGGWLAATPLRDPLAGGTLTADKLAEGTPRVERYRLYWTRRNG